MVKEQWNPDKTPMKVPENVGGAAGLRQPTSQACGAPAATYLAKQKIVKK